MHVEFTSNLGRLQEIEPAWSTLADTSSWPNVFLAPWFVMSALPLSDRVISHAFVWDSDVQQTLIGYMPLDTAISSQPFRPMRAENWTHAYSFLGEPLIRPGHEYAFWDTLLTAIDERPDFGSTLRLKRLRGEGPSFEALRAVLQNTGRWYADYRQLERAFLKHEGSYESFLQTHLTKKRRKEARRLMRRLQEHGDACVDRFVSAQETSEWTRQFLELEQSGWKGRENTAMASRADSKALFETIVQKAAATDQVDILRLRLDDHIIAMLVSFTAGSIGAFQFKIAYDEDYATFSPGVLIELAYTERALGGEMGALQWTDSCAAEDHPMIDKIWRDRLALTSIKIAPRRRFAKALTIYDDKLTRMFNKDNS